jgi:hypothetical protein
VCFPDFSIEREEREKKGSVWNWGGWVGMGLYIPYHHRYPKVVPRPVNFPGQYNVYFLQSHLFRCLRSGCSMIFVPAARTQIDRSQIDSPKAVLRSKTRPRRSIYKSSISTEFNKQSPVSGLCSPANEMSNAAVWMKGRQLTPVIGGRAAATIANCFDKNFAV